MWSQPAFPRLWALNGADPAQQVMDGRWTGSSGGAAPHATGTAPTLTLSAPASAAADGAVAVEATLRRPDGTPVEGARLSFDLQRVLPIMGVNTMFTSTWHIAAVTDAEGIARANLPTATTKRTWWGGSVTLDPAWTWRILASYDGSDDLYPAKTTQTLTITSSG